VFEFEGYQMACHGTILDIWYTLTIELDRQETGRKKQKKKKLTQNTRSFLDAYNPIPSDQTNQTQPPASLIMSNTCKYTDDARAV
jgi:hypothetical protein